MTQADHWTQRQPRDGYFDSRRVGPIGWSGIARRFNLPPPGYDGSDPVRLPPSRWAAMRQWFLDLFRL